MIVFQVSPWFISYKTSKYLICVGFLKILGKNGPNFAENGSRSLKSRYLKNTFSIITWERNVLESKIEFEAYIIHFFLNEVKNQKSNCNIFSNHFPYKLVKFQLSSMFLSQVVIKNAILSFGTHFWQKWPVFT